MNKPLGFDDDNVPDILHVLRRPPECPLMRELWRDEGMPGAKDFRAEVDLSWIASWSGPASGPDVPFGRILDAGEKNLLYVSNAPVGCKILERVGGDRVRVLPVTLGIAGSRAGFAPTSRHFFVADRSTPGRAYALRLETMELTGAHALTSARNLRLPAPPEGLAEDFNRRLREAVQRLAPLAGSRSTCIGPDGWPIVLCRDVVGLRTGVSGMEGILSRFAQLVFTTTGHSAHLGLTYLRPGQDGSPSELHLATGELRMFLADAEIDRLARGFRAARDREWPDGWMQLVGPERTSRRLVEPLAMKMRKSSRSKLSNHALLRAQADLL